MPWPSLTTLTFMVNNVSLVNETTTLSDWVDGLHGAGELRDVVRLTEWAAYAPNLAPPDSVTNAVAVCRTAVRTWPLSRFQRLASETRRS